MGVLVKTPVVALTILHGSVNSFLNLPRMILKAMSVLMKLLIMRILPLGWLNSMSSNYPMTMACVNVHIVHNQ